MCGFGRKTPAYVFCGQAPEERLVLIIVSYDWIIFIIMVFMLKLIWNWHKDWKHRHDAKVERLKRVNRNYARQIAGEEKR